MTVLLAVAAAITYGVGDFLGGLSARRWRVYPATLISAAVAAVVLAVTLLFTGGQWSPMTLVSGGLSGLFAAIGFLAFYAALAIGPISIVAPLIALLNSVVPVLWSTIFGAKLSPIAWIAIAIAIVGSVLAGTQSGESAHGIRGKTLIYSLVSGLSFGLCIVSLSLAPQAAGLIPAFLDSGVSTVLLLLLLGVALVSRPVRRWLSSLDEPSSAVGTPHGPDIDVTSGSIQTIVRNPAAGVRLGIFSGVFTAVANASLILALHSGDLAVVAVLNNLYPISTIVLAWVVVRERLSAMQLGGVVLAVIASVLLGLA